MVEPEKVPRSLEPSAIPVKVCRSEASVMTAVREVPEPFDSTEVSRAWRAALMVWLSAMVAPVKSTQVQIILSSTRQRCHVVDVGLVGVDQVLSTVGGTLQQRHHLP